jgi:hypothetical protein
VTTNNRTSPVGSIRRCGPATFHQGETLTVVADGEAAARSVPNTVTIDQAHALVSLGEAVWIDEPRALDDGMPRASGSAI